MVSVERRAAGTSWFSCPGGFRARTSSLGSLANAGCRGSALGMPLFCPASVDVPDSEVTASGTIVTRQHSAAQGLRLGMHVLADPEALKRALAAIVAAAHVTAHS